MISVPIINDTIPHPIRQNFGAAKIILKPASKGTGIIAGGPVRIIADLAGIKNISAKILGSDNKINNLKATILALQNLRTKRER
ncbi:30S ribosomal protein S5 [subsurface metagenome]